MDIDISQWYGLAGVPVIQALTALVKKVIPEIPDKYTPAVAVFWGVVLNLVLAYILQSDYKVAAFVGVIAALISVGLYDYAKAKAANP